MSRGPFAAGSQFSNNTSHSPIAKYTPSPTLSSNVAYWAFLGEVDRWLVALQDGIKELEERRRRRLALIGGDEGIEAKVVGTRMMVCLTLFPLNERIVYIVNRTAYRFNLFNQEMQVRHEAAWLQCVLLILSDLGIKVLRSSLRLYNPLAVISVYS
jgi:hypothetical protein